MEDLLRRSRERAGHDRTSKSSFNFHLEAEANSPESSSHAPVREAALRNGLRNPVLSP